MDCGYKIRSVTTSVEPMTFLESVFKNDNVKLHLFPLCMVLCSLPSFIVLLVISFPDSSLMSLPPQPKLILRTTNFCKKRGTLVS